MSVSAISCLIHDICCRELQSELAPAKLDCFLACSADTPCARFLRQRGLTSDRRCARFPRLKGFCLIFNEALQCVLGDKLWQRSSVLNESVKTEANCEAGVLILSRPIQTPGIKVEIKRFEEVWQHKQHFWNPDSVSWSSSLGGQPPPCCDNCFNCLLTVFWLIFIRRVEGFLSVELSYSSSAIMSYLNLWYKPFCNMLCSSHSCRDISNHEAELWPQTARLGRWNRANDLCQVNSYQTHTHTHRHTHVCTYT